MKDATVIRNRQDGKALVLATEDASLSTVSVTIKAVQVGKKQLTQSVFRQLQVDKLVDEERVLLRGVPWGYVHYFWGGDGSPYSVQSPLRHFLVQFGGVLRRCPTELPRSRSFQGLDPSKWPSRYRDLRRLLQDFLRARIIRGLLDATVEPAGAFHTIGFDFGSHVAEFHIMVKENGSDFSCPIQPLWSADWIKQSRWRIEHDVKCGRDVSPSYRAAVEKARAKAEEILTQIAGPDNDRRSLDLRIEEIRRSAIDYCSRWDDLMERLDGLEQLFIAV